MKQLFALVFAAAAVLTVSAAKADCSPKKGYTMVKTGADYNGHGEIVTRCEFIPTEKLGIQRFGTQTISLKAGKPPINLNASVGRRDHY